MTSNNPTLPRSAVVPLLCAVHCMGTPLLVLVAPAIAENSRLEWGGFVAAAVIALFATVVGVRVHRVARVWVPVLAGLAVWLAARLDAVPLAPEWMVTSLGALVLVGGVVWNARLRHRAECPDCGCRVGTRGT